MWVCTSFKMPAFFAIVLDAGIDQLIDYEFLKDIPILGIAYKTFTLANKITEHFFIKKILLFLFQLKDIPKPVSKKFVEELQKGKESKKVGEKLLVVLNRLDDINKAGIVGKLYKAIIENYITKSDFFRLTSFVNRCFIDDLRLLKGTERPETLSIEIKENLAQVGLFVRKIKDNREQEEYVNSIIGSTSHKISPSFDYEINKYGKLLVKFGL
jgi:hypothetical protein